MHKRKRTIWKNPRVWPALYPTYRAAPFGPANKQISLFIKVFFVVLSHHFIMLFNHHFALVLAVSRCMVMSNMKRSNYIYDIIVLDFYILISFISVCMYYVYLCLLNSAILNFLLLHNDCRTVSLNILFCSFICF